MYMVAHSGRFRKHQSTHAYHSHIVLPYFTETDNLILKFTHVSFDILPYQYYNTEIWICDINKKTVIMEFSIYTEWNNQWNQ